MTTYNTNLAAEFYVLSMLHRLGADAGLTLGNKKAVDIVVTNGTDALTVDVKGVAGPYDWPADNIKVLDKASHFYVLVAFDGHIADPLRTPSVWIVPSLELMTFIRAYRTRKVISRAAIKKCGRAYAQAWNLLCNASAALSQAA